MTELNDKLSTEAQPAFAKHVLAAAASVTLATKQTVVIKFFERGKLNHS